MEKAELGSMPVCCMAMCIASPCTTAKGRIDVAAKYGIQEGLPMAVIQTLCCPACSAIQVLNQILVKENLTWGCCGVAPPAGAGAPEVQTIER